MNLNVRSTIIKYWQVQLEKYIIIDNQKPFNKIGGKGIIKFSIAIFLSDKQMKL